MNKKKICKVEDGKKIAGVCAGFGEYFGIDATWIRLAWALFTLVGGCGLLAYIVAAIVLPNESDVLPPAPPME